MSVDETGRDPFVVAVDHLDTRRRSNILLDAGDDVALDEHVGLVNACVLAALDAGRNSTPFEQIFRHDC